MAVALADQKSQYDNCASADLEYSRAAMVIYVPPIRNGTRVRNAVAETELAALIGDPKKARKRQSVARCPVIMCF